MNGIKLLQLNSTDSLSTKMADVVYVFIIPAICAVGIIQKILSINVLLIILNKNDRIKRKYVYNYMLAMEIVDLIQGMICCFVALFRCGSFCSLSK